MTLDTLSVQIDVQDARIKQDRIAVLLSGLNWDMLASTGVMVDFVTRTGMLLPLPLVPEWQTNSGGRYTRLKLLDYQFVTQMAWLEHNRRFDGDTYLHSLGVNEGVVTSQVWPANQPVFLGWVNYNTGTDSYVQMECGWSMGDGGGSFPGNLPAFPTVPDIRLRFWSDGKVEIYKTVFRLGEGMPTNGR